MKQLNRVMYREKKSIRLLKAFTALTAAAMIAQAYFFVKVVDEVFLQDATFREIVPFLVGLLLVSFFRVFCMYAVKRTSISLAGKAKQKLREELVETFIANPLQASLSGQTGRKINILLDAVDEVDPYFSIYIPQRIQMMFIPLAIVIAVFTQHFYSGLLLLITAPFIPLAMALVGMKTKQKSEEQMEQMAKFSGNFLDTLQGILTIKLFGHMKKQKQEMQSSSDGFRDATMKVLKVAFLSALSLEFISMMSIGLIAFELGLQIVVFQQVSFFSAFFILILVPDFYLSLKEYGSAFHAGKGSYGAAKLIFEELEKEKTTTNWGHHQLEEAAPQMEWKDVTFQYEKNGFAVQSSSFTIEPLEKVAIVGPNGAGKTTMLHLLSGLIQPNSGEIRVNNNLLGQYDEKNWFEQISYISQFPYIFSGSIRDNLIVGTNKKVTLEELEEAVSLAGLSELIRKLPNGLDTVIGEGGRGLSGGEMQRLAIARAFLNKPRLLFFDEPTNGLDLYTEKVLQNSMKQLGKEATVITVAHRLHTILEADKILYLENGKVVASGTHHQLLQEELAYRRMFQKYQGEGTA